MEYKSSLDKPIVRDSKVRNVFHKVCKKELFYTNLKVNTQSEELLKSSKRLFAYPSLVGGGSCLAINKIENHGKSADTPFCIKGHTDPISCFEFSNFNDHVVATGSRDCTIKIWEVPEEGLKENLVTPLISLPKQSKRITGVYFHPSVDSLFVSSSMDYSIDLWDLAQDNGAVVQKLTGNEDLVMSVGWNTWSGGERLATSSRDKKMRLYDPRSSNTPIATVSTHEGAQGFKLTWADSNGLDLLCTVGANKAAQRQLFIWDPRQLQGAQGPVVSKNVTTDSSILSPYYDYATNILYLGGKGDGIYYYELEKKDAHLIGKAAFGNATQSAISLLPKSVVDVNLCEIDRFLRLTNNCVEMVSFIVPRKSQLFQEDIFPPSPSGDPTTDCSLWFQDKNLKVIPHTTSMKPEGATSIYDVSEEEGGKSKQKDKLEQLQSNTLNNKETFITEGIVKQDIEGWLFNTYEPRYLKIVKDKIYCFLNEDSAQANWEVAINNIKYVDIYQDPNSGEKLDPEWATRFNIILSNGKEYRMECGSIEQRDAWTTSINAHKEMKTQLDSQNTSPTLGEFHLVNTTPNNAASPMNISENNNKALPKFGAPPPSSSSKPPLLPPSSSSPSTSSPSTSSPSTTPGSGTPTATRHSVLSRNPSYTSLKLSGGMSKPSTPNNNAVASPLSISANNGGGSLNNSTGMSAPSSSSLSSSTGIKQNEIVIEGALTELVPGLLWNSNVEKWYVVSEGMLYGYKNKQLKALDPIETIHLEKAISAHKTKEIFTIQGFSFQLSTPNRIIHLLSKTKEERSSWLSVLKQNLKSSGESKPAKLTRTPTTEELVSAPLDDENNTNEGGIEEEEEEEQLEGQMQRKLPGIFSMWGQCFVSLLAEDLFVSKNKISTAPELRIQLSSISAIKKNSPNEFTLFDGNNAVVCNFRTILPTEDFDDCKRWIEGLEAARKRSIDIIKMFGINEKEVLSSSEISHEEENLARFLDINAIKNGKQKVLIQVKGKRKIRVRVVKLSSSSLNTHNSFILDAGPRIFVWAGSKASRVNKAKALDFANRIRQKERGGKSTLIQFDENRGDDQSMDFWDILGGKPTSPIATTPTPEEQDAENIKTSIYRIGLDSKKNSLRARLAWEGSDWRLPNKEILNTKFVFVIDCVSEIFIWVGKESSSMQRKMAIKVALVLQAQSDRTDWTKITRVNEFGENNLFKEKFANYPGMLPISTTKQEIKNYVATQKAEHKLEVLSGRLNTPFVDNEVIFTNESGRIKIWKIEDYEKIDHPQSLYSNFYSGDSYIVLYTYMLNNKEAHVIYYYLGRDSTINEKGTSAYLTVDLQESLTGSCVQVRVVQNKECRNFLNLFKGKMITHKGKFNKYDANQTALYQVKGKDSIDCRAVQVDASSSMLNTLNSYVLTNGKDKVFIWNGKFSLEVQQQTSNNIARILAESNNKEIITIREGQETDDFWSLIGGDKSLDKYFNSLTIQQSTIPTSFNYESRLFICNNSSGINEINEESPFSQDDLEIGSACILDVQSHIYIWLGTRCAHRAKRASMEAVLDFIKKSKFGHSMEHTKVQIIEPFHEPIEFRAYFRSWCTSKYPKNKLPLVEKPAIDVNIILKDYLKEIYSYEELLADPLPAGVDSTKLENYLSDEEFEKVFNMKRSEWEKIPTWKREPIKKSLYLF
ncbi:hypothetical protein DICPUDRAFT_46298 [Dictyostelium purpureum]|uniref:Villin n=1 Tax=Dictyostelium purpureum TaxID=5786 RepID=F0ZE89_DICPU|nr:uncharacterized protein DICPUDRAFT_46298 [Dictyostelium purpureum]EGC37711.1 hypothetical protein DICPUDRAFT_46298 [Dictyostelium purpureum]|eukprot:XP_003285732.1 hypothetical protein DICPUDRAFT_46298 [Dictyostelium purpureum]